MEEAICVSYLTENMPGSDRYKTYNLENIYQWLICFFYKMSTRWTGHHTTMTDDVFKRAQDYNSTLQWRLNLVNSVRLLCW